MFVDVQLRTSLGLRPQAVLAEEECLYNDTLNICGPSHSILISASLYTLLSVAVWLKCDVSELNYKSYLQLFLLLMDSLRYMGSRPPPASPATRRQRDEQ